MAAAAAVALVVAAVRRRRQRLTVLCQAGKPTPVHNPTCRSPQEDKGDTVDENDPRMTKMYDGRQESPAPNLESCGFELASTSTTDASHGLAMCSSLLQCGAEKRAERAFPRPFPRRLRVSLLSQHNTMQNMEGEQPQQPPQNT